MGRATSTDVLLIEGEADVSVLFEDVLERMGRRDVSIERADTHDSGLAALRSGRHHLCILGERLGRRSGLELLREAQSLGSRVPIVFVAVEGTDDLEQEVLRLGAVDYLAKRDLSVEPVARALRQALARQEAMHRRQGQEGYIADVFRAASDAMLVADDSARYVDANPAACALLGISRERLLEKKVGELAGHSAFPQAAWRAFLATGHSQGEWELLRSDGTRVVIESRSTANIVPGKHLSVLRDITERRRAEATARRLVAIMESADEAIIGTSPDGTITDWNVGAESLYGYSALEAVGQNVAMLTPPDREVELQGIRARLRSGEITRNLETVRRRKNGERVDVMLTVTPLRDAHGGIAGGSAMVRDLSEVNRLRTRVAIADRMASLGTLAAGIAHEINNPLAVVAMDVHLASRAVASATAGSSASLEEAVTALREAGEAAERVRLLVKDLKLFSRIDKEERAAVDVRRPIETALRMVANEIRHRAQTFIHFDGGLPTVDANEARLVQVFMNLLVNAAQAIPEGKAEAHEIRISAEGGQDRVLVKITDSGAGMSPDVIKRMFEPFFTTKGIGMGTGLGLAICHRIVTDLGGELSISSEVGKGTTVIVSLPPGTLQPPQVEATPAADDARSSRRGRVLVVDDEPRLVKAITGVLKEWHDVEGTTSGREALSRLTAGAHYDVVLCDIMMPDLTGMDLYAELRATAPQLAERVVFLTGGAFTSRARTFLEMMANRTLQKPVSPEKLLTTVAELIR